MVTFYFKTGLTEGGIRAIPLFIVLLILNLRVCVTVRLFIIMVAARSLDASIPSSKAVVRQTKVVEFDDTASHLVFLVSSNYTVMLLGVIKSNGKCSPVKVMLSPPIMFRSKSGSAF